MALPIIIIQVVTYLDWLVWVSVHQIMILSSVMVYKKSNFNINWNILKYNLDVYWFLHQ